MTDSLAWGALYVVTLAANIEIDYNGKISQVLYVGRGALKQRSTSHLKKWIPAITSSIYDFGLFFWMIETKKAGNGNLFKQIESDLIAELRAEYSRVPLQNKINGKSDEKYHSHCEGWNKPFRKNNEMKYESANRPLDKNA